MNQLILASGSPRRKELLTMAGIPFEIVVPDTDENYPAELSIEEIPVFIARMKARAVASMHPERTILAADTIVVWNGEVIGKPRDKQDAMDILGKLSGQTHTVMTGVCISGKEFNTEFTDITKVHFHPIRPDQIEYYVDHFKPYDKAGAYAIQEWIGAVAIRGIEGCFYNVMGLPVSRVVQALRG
ncbi:MAG TPA: Maf family protein [Chitinophagaceae bacterium]|nr:Maf family protein [Chitinophagaceae bacterium]HNF72695.1 Maf family protein [Chitinophagaceae bacterium]